MFSGSVTKAQGSSYYQLKFNGDMLPLCGGNLYYDCGELSKIETYNLGNYMTPTLYGWGYDSKDSRILAITMLGMYAGAGGMATLSHISYRSPSPAKFSNISISNILTAREFVKKHYKAFTTEVIANLPDNWTMTMDDIDKWVKEKEKNDQENH